MRDLLLALGASLCLGGCRSAPSDSLLPPLADLSGLARPNAVACEVDGRIDVVADISLATAVSHRLVLGEDGVRAVGQRCGPGQSQLLIAQGRALRYDGKPVAHVDAPRLSGIPIPRGTVVESVYLGAEGDAVGAGFKSFCPRRGTDDEMNTPGGFALVEDDQGQPQFLIEGGSAQQHLMQTTSAKGATSMVPAAVRDGVIVRPRRRPYCDKDFG